MAYLQHPVYKIHCLITVNGVQHTLYKDKEGKIWAASEEGKANFTLPNIEILSESTAKTLSAITSIAEKVSVKETETRETQVLLAFPCKYRGDRLRVEDKDGGCALTASPIYACSEPSVGGEAALWRYCSAQTTPTCQRCTVRQPIAN